MLPTTHYPLPTSKGASLIDVLVGIAFLVTAFTALFGALTLAVRVVMHTKARVGAVALANERVEFLRSLPYASVGTAGGIPAGAVPQIENITLNTVSYTRRTLIQYVDAPEDGEGLDDENGITADYKLAKVDISWKVQGVQKSFFVVTTIAPPGIESFAGGGTLIVNVTDSFAVPVSGVLVHIENNSLVPAVFLDTLTNSAGRVMFPGSPAAGSYEIRVTKSGYGTAETYDTDATNPNPNPGHLTVVAGHTTSATFEIDLLSSKTIRTFEPIREEIWEDSFDNLSRVFSQASTTVAGGVVTLEDLSGTGEEYETEGRIISHAIEPSYLAGWKELSWEEATPPATSITYRLHYMHNLESIPIPDSDFSGNAAGFTASPITLVGLNAELYPRIQIAATLATSDASTTPTLSLWRISYDRGPVPLLNLAFSMHGLKTIGTDTGGLPIYKYSQNLSTNGAGVLALPTLDPDTYTITVESGTGFDVSEACPLQPRVIPPASATTTDLLLVPNTPNSLKIAVMDGARAVLSGASVRLTRTGFDDMQVTGSCGQAFWGGLGQGTVAAGTAYTLDATLAGYLDAHVADVEVDGASEVTVTMAP